MTAKINSMTMSGGKAVPVTVEVNTSSGIGIHVVGLADQSFKEMLLRTITALQHLGFRIPGKKITVNIAPADLTKTAEYHDVAIAAGIIASSGQMELPLLEDYIITGRLNLDAGVRGDIDPYAAAEAAKSMNLKGCILPEESAIGITDTPAVPVYGRNRLQDILSILAGHPEPINI